nr:hypothetical protein CFP56_48621 [Quercus suber]
MDHKAFQTLGHVAMEEETNAAISSEESDLLVRSTKEQKASSADFHPQRPIRSYKDSLFQPHSDWEDHSLQNLRITDTDADSDQDDGMDDVLPNTPFKGRQASN